MTHLYVKDLFGEYAPASPELIIAEAKRRLATKFRRGTALTSPHAVREALRLRMADYPFEVFMCLFLDNQYRIIELRELFRGTIDGAAVYPRKVVKAALGCNAAAVVLVHNHPSGLVEIRVLDHFIVGAEEVFSFAENGLL